MRVAIVHYHLRPGGVSTVIRSTSEILTGAGVRHVILVGDSPAPDLPCRVVDGLGYRRHPSDLTSDESLAVRLSAESSLHVRLLSAAHDSLGGPPDIWHFHNHSLGKNTLLPEFVDRLATLGERIILHLHDLAEDGRPQNYPVIHDPRILYPVSPGIRYAFINPRDRQHFIDAGLPESVAIFLPNPLPPLSPRSSPASSSGPLVLYPVRGIRRKNLGEILLLSKLAPAGTRFAITRRPENPEAVPGHDHWRTFAEKESLPVDFDVVDRIPPPASDDSAFSSWMDHSTHRVTTSVAEGFGLVANESAADGKPLFGRNLHSTPAPHLYERILVPAAWIDSASLRRHLNARLVETHRLYRKPLDPSLVDRTFDSLHHVGYLDFGNLPELLQQKVILRLSDKDAGEIFVDSNGTLASAADWLANQLESCDVSHRPKPSPYPILDLYRDVADLVRDSVVESGLPPDPHPPRRWPYDLRYLSPDTILDAYLDNGNFHFLLTAPPEIRAVIFDIYGTLAISPPAAIRPDRSFDPILAEIIGDAGYPVTSSVTTALHRLLVSHHAASTADHPEIDLRELWSELLGTEVSPELIQTIEDAWHPIQPMPGAAEIIRHLHQSGIRLGFLSNAQLNTLPALDRILGNITQLFEPDLTFLSYQHRIAKPSPLLFGKLADALAARGIAPDETLYVGNDPLQDIVPAANAGFRTALFTGHPDSLRPGICSPDLTINSLSDLSDLIQKL